MLDTNAAAPFQSPPSARDLLDRWTWRDLTDAMRESGFPAKSTRYVEVAHSGGYTLLSIDNEDGRAVVWNGVEIDWADVVVADVRGKRSHEEDLSVGELSAFPRVA